MPVRRDHAAASAPCQGLPEPHQSPPNHRIGTRPSSATGYQRCSRSSRQHHHASRARNGHASGRSSARRNSRSSARRRRPARWHSMAQTASAAVIAAVCPSSTHPQEPDLPVGGEEEQAAGDHTGGGAGQPGPEPVHADHREQAGGARDEQPERGSGAAREREHARAQHRERLPRRTADGGEVEVPDLAPPDQPRPHVVGRARRDQQRQRPRSPRRRRRRGSGCATTPPTTGRRARRDDAQVEVPSAAGAKVATGPTTTTVTSSPTSHAVVARSGSGARGRSGGAPASPARDRGTCGRPPAPSPRPAGVGRGAPNRGGSRRRPGRRPRDRSPAPPARTRRCRSRRRRCSTSASPRNSAIHRVTGCR